MTEHVTINISLGSLIEKVEIKVQNSDSETATKEQISRQCESLIPIVREKFLQAFETALTQAEKVLEANSVQGS